MEQPVDNFIEKRKLPSFFSANRDELLSRFISILLTALVSALITFLQSLLAEPETASVLQQNIDQAGLLGATIRTAQEFIKSRKA